MLRRGGDRQGRTNERGHLTDKRGATEQQFEPRHQRGWLTDVLAVRCCVWLLLTVGCTSSSVAVRQQNGATADVERAPSTPEKEAKGEVSLIDGAEAGRVGAPDSSSAGSSQAGGEGAAVRDTSGRFVELQIADFVAAGARAKQAFPPAVVWVPRGNARRPLLVAAHGAGGRPEPHCERWQSLVGERAFVLCVRGAKTNRRDPLSSSHHYYPDHLWLGHAVDASVAALMAQQPRVDAEAAVYAGYSQGAVMGALMLMERAQRFPRALLIEGQQNDWNVAGAARWKRAGGLRVGLVCGLLLCAQSQERSRQSLARGGVDVTLRYASGGGHTYTGAVGERVSELLEWLVADDARWAGAAQ